MKVDPYTAAIGAFVAIMLIAAAVAWGGIPQ